MASFVRQLNMYGFRKVVHIEQGGLVKPEKDDTEFQHPYFIRGQEHLLENIKRKVTSVSSIKNEDIKVRQDNVTKLLTDIQVMKGKQESMDSKLIAMKQNQYGKNHRNPNSSSVGESIRLDSVLSAGRRSSSRGAFKQRAGRRRSVPGCWCLCLLAMPALIAPLLSEVLLPLCKARGRKVRQRGCHFLVIHRLCSSPVGAEVYPDRVRLGSAHEALPWDAESTSS
nr:PREDICTED: heat shock factor protein 4-like isoform X2 [Apteryx mantelli mantelli]